MRLIVSEDSHKVILLIKENGALVPTLFDPALSTELAHHLFEIQMGMLTRDAL